MKLISIKEIVFDCTVLDTCNEMPELSKISK